eukprot:2874413-Pleurochrysis_carterae.AAC.1
MLLVPVAKKNGRSDDTERSAAHVHGALPLGQLRRACGRHLDLHAERCVCACIRERTATWTVGQRAVRRAPTISST